MTKMTAEDRTEHLLDVAVDLAEKIGFDNLTRDGIATAAGVSFCLVTFRLGHTAELRRNVMRRALKRQSLPVIAQGLARNDKVAAKASSDLKQRAAAWLAQR